MNSSRCPQCGFLNFSTATACKRCKTEFASTAANDFTSDFSRQELQGFSEPAFQTESFAPPSFEPARRNERYAAPHNQFAPAKKQKTGLALSSMILGCVGFVLCWGMFGLLSVIGLVLGIIALVKAKKKPLEYGGQGFAIAGVITNGLLVLILPVIAAIAIPNLLAARRAANEGSAIASLRTIMQAESTYIRANRSSRCGDLSDLANSSLIDSTLASGQKNGYKFDIAKRADSSCEFFATPLVASGVSKSGTRSFYVSSQDWQIRAADKNGLPASNTDPMLRMLNSRPNSGMDDEDY